MRATKDLDVVLIGEAPTPAHSQRFWGYIEQHQSQPGKATKPRVDAVPQRR